MKKSRVSLARSCYGKHKYHRDFIECSGYFPGNLAGCQKSRESFAHCILREERARGGIKFILSLSPVSAVPEAVRFFWTDIAESQLSAPSADTLILLKIPGYVLDWINSNTAGNSVRELLQHYLALVGRVLGALGVSVGGGTCCTTSSFMAKEESH